MDSNRSESGNDSQGEDSDPQSKRTSLDMESGEDLELGAVAGSGDEDGTLYQCCECPTAFPTEDELQNHMRVHFLEKSASPAVDEENKTFYQCCECPCAFPTERELQNHMKIHSMMRGESGSEGEEGTLFQCCECPTAFPTETELENHMKIHSLLQAQEKLHQCPHCPAAFSGGSKLRLHIRTHTGERPYPCDQCPAAFTSSTSLKVHRRSHSGEKPYQCPQCPSAFTISSNLRVHLRIHSGEKPYVCSECPAAFVSSSGLKVHVTRNHIRKPYKPIRRAKRDAMFPFPIPQGDPETVQMYMELMRRNTEIIQRAREAAGGGTSDDGEGSQMFVENEPETGMMRMVFDPDTQEAEVTKTVKTESPPAASSSDNINMPVIKKPVLHKGGRRRVAIIKKEPETMPSESNTSKGKAGTPTPLKEVPATPQKEKRHKCHECPAAFTTSKDLKRHIRSHTGERPYPCSICPAAFAEASKLKIHMRSHTGEKPYSCELCGTCFTAASSLKVHMRLHSGEKPYSCTVCPATFAKASNLRIHMRAHTGERPYKCSECSAAFSMLSNLRVHERTHSGDKPFTCEECGATFAHSSSLKGHMRKHTGEKPYQCPDCFTCFAQAFTLRRHMKTGACKRETREFSEGYAAFVQAQMATLSQAAALGLFKTTDGSTDDDQSFSKLSQGAEDSLDDESSASGFKSSLEGHGPAFRIKGERPDFEPLEKASKPWEESPSDSQNKVAAPKSRRKGPAARRGRPPACKVQDAVPDPELLKSPVTQKQDSQHLAENPVFESQDSTPPRRSRRKGPAAKRGRRPAVRVVFGSPSSPESSESPAFPEFERVASKLPNHADIASPPAKKGPQKGKSNAKSRVSESQEISPVSKSQDEGPVSKSPRKGPAAKSPRKVSTSKSKSRAKAVSPKSDDDSKSDNEGPVGKPGNESTIGKSQSEGRVTMSLQEVRSLAAKRAKAMGPKSLQRVLASKSEDGIPASESGAGDSVPKPDVGKPPKSNNDSYASDDGIKDPAVVADDSKSSYRSSEQERVPSSNSQSLPSFSQLSGMDSTTHSSIKDSKPSSYPQSVNQGDSSVTQTSPQGPSFSKPKAFGSEKTVPKPRAYASDETLPESGAVSSEANATGASSYPQAADQKFSQARPSPYPSQGPSPYPQSDGHSHTPYPQGGSGSMGSFQQSRDQGFPPYPQQPGDYPQYGGQGFPSYPQYGGRGFPPFPQYGYQSPFPQFNINIYQGQPTYPYGDPGMGPYKDAPDRNHPGYPPYSQFSDQGQAPFIKVTATDGGHLSYSQTSPRDASTFSPTGHADQSSFPRSEESGPPPFSKAGEWGASQFSPAGSRGVDSFPQGSDRSFGSFAGDRGVGPYAQSGYSSVPSYYQGGHPGFPGFPQPPGPGPAGFPQAYGHGGFAHPGAQDFLPYPVSGAHGSAPPSGGSSEGHSSMHSDIKAENQAIKSEKPSE